MCYIYLIMTKSIVPSLEPLIAINPKKGRKVPVSLRRITMVSGFEQHEKLKEVIRSLRNKSTLQTNIPLQGSLEFQNQRLNDTIARTTKNPNVRNNEFIGIVRSLYQLMSKEPIDPSELNFETSIEDWKKQITTAVNQIATGLREFVRKLLNDHGQIPVIQKNKEQLRGFAGLNDRNELITKPVN